MFKTFCRCNAAVSDLYDGKSKNKIAVIFFPNFHGCIFQNEDNLNRLIMFLMFPRDSIVSGS